MIKYSRKVNIEGIQMLDVAIIGLGSDGLELVNTLNKHSYLRIQCICDNHFYHLQRVAGTLPFIRSTHDFRQVVRDPKVDWIFLATPTDTQFELGMSALKGQKNLLLTKPPLMGKKQYEMMLEEAQKWRRRVVSLSSKRELESASILLQRLKSPQTAEVQHSIVLNPPIIPPFSPFNIV